MSTRTANDPFMIVAQNRVAFAPLPTDNASMGDPIHV